MTPRQFNEYQRQADTIEQHKKWKESQDMALQNQSESKVIPELSDEEIKKWIDSTPYYGHCTTEYKEGLDDGIKWYREQLKQQRQ